LKVVEQGQASSNNLIGQFGVGFYSLFMVSKKVKVYSRSAKDPTAPGHIWTSDGSGTYSVSEAEGVQRGTKIIIELDEKSHEFAQRHMIENVIKKYSNFVGFDIKLNGATVNTVKAIWTLPKESLTEKDHKEFYQFIAHAYDTPMYHLHYSTDSPINVRAIFYVPEQHMEKYGLGLMEPGVNLFSRKILIQAKCKGLLPDWLRFIRGVVDSEEVPLNLSRETLQDSQLVKRLGSVLTRRILKFFEEQAKTDPEKFEKFVKEYGQFLKQGVCTDLKWKEDIAKLLRVESSHTVEGQVTSFDDYISRMVEKQQNIYYLVVPSRANAEASPYFETFKARGVEVMFLYQSIDDFVMTNLGEYKGKKVVSIESSNAAEEIYNLPTKKTDDQKDETEEDLPALTGDAFKEFATWLKEMLVLRVTTVTESARLSSSPAIVVDHESAAFRRMMRAVDPGRPTIIPKVQLQINPKHPIITRLDAVRKVDGVLAQEAAEQIMDNALIQAGLIEDSRTMVPRLNKLLERALKVASHPATPSDTTN
jgi:HSP90 family molecular chaperone